MHRRIACGEPEVGHHCRRSLCGGCFPRRCRRWWRWAACNDSLAPLHGTFGTPKAGNHHAPFVREPPLEPGAVRVRQPVAGHPSPPIVACLSSPHAGHTRTGHLCVGGAGPTPRLAWGLVSELCLAVLQL